MINGVSLKSVKLEETVFDGHIADKMECFHGPHCTNPIQFLWQVPWLRSVRIAEEKLEKGTRAQGIYLPQYRGQIILGHRDRGW